MLSIAKKEFVLEGLDCANCSAKIEFEANQIAGVRASVNFVTKTFTIETEADKDLESILDQIKAIVNKYEPHVIVREKVIHRGAQEKIGERNVYNSDNTKKEMIRLGIGAALFALGLIVNLSHSMRWMVFLVTYVVVGGEIVLRALKNIARGQIFDENFLMTIATMGAFAIGELPEGVAVMLFYKVGEFFQELAVNRSRKSIGALMDIRPEFANLKLGNHLTKVSPEEVRVGDLIVVKPGEKIPLDGRVVEGTSMVDTSALTGESLPREVEIGNEVLSGFINKNSVLTIEVTKEFGESTVSKILDLVQNATSRKAPTENFITKFARYYTPVVVIIAAILATIPPLLITGATFSDWIYRALVFLVISCPCALVVSIPLGFFGGIGGASQNGVLIKGSNYLEGLNNVETVIFDKTGTLTKAVFKVTEINPQGNYTKEELLEWAAYGESYSNHPIATSILKAYTGQVNQHKIENYEEIAGCGIKVKVEGKEILVGNRKLMDREKIGYSKVESIGTVVHVALDRMYVGYIVIADEVKEDAASAIKALKSLGIQKTVMLTGDVRVVAERVGEELGVDEVYAELLPTEKVEKLELLDERKSPRGKLVFVGDGINDAPVLARADIGIAMGGLGSDAAIEAADVVIMTDEPSKIATAIKIAKRTRMIVWQNIVLSMGIKLLFLVLGAFGVTSLWEAVFADVGVALLAVLNAMRVMK